MSVYLVCVKIQTISLELQAVRKLYAFYIHSDSETENKIIHNRGKSNKKWVPGDCSLMQWVRFWSAFMIGGNQIYRILPHDSTNPVCFKITQWIQVRRKCFSTYHSSMSQFQSSWSWLTVLASSQKIPLTVLFLTCDFVISYFPKTRNFEIKSQTSVFLFEKVVFSVPFEVLISKFDNCITWVTIVCDKGYS